jgi:hypothetical protein
MKTTTTIFFFFVLMFTRCKNDTDIVKGFYNSMHFVREGGGQIEFIIYPTDNFNKLNAVVTKYNFKDTTIQITIDVNSDNSSVLSSLNKAMNNQIQINGDFKQSTLPSGSWASIYLVTDKKETEVTNTGLRNLLLNFEQIIRDKIH